MNRTVMMEKSRWIDLMKYFNLGDNQQTFAALVNAHAEKHRHYHTSEHINACLSHLDKVHTLAGNAQEIELALWFHDAIYHPYRGDNEIKSAQLAHQFLSDNGVDNEVINCIEQLIMVTLHTEADVSLTGDQALMVDIDLSILGSREGVYEIYEKNIRQEYRFVPFFLYKKKRKEILQMFLDQSRIYHSDHFFDMFEKQARENISKAIRTL